MSDKQPTWLTAADAAQVLKCTQRQVHYYGEQGKLATSPAACTRWASSAALASSASMGGRILTEVI